LKKEKQVSRNVTLRGAKRRGIRSERRKREDGVKFSSGGGPLQKKRTETRKNKKQTGLQGVRVRQHKRGGRGEFKGKTTWKR